MLSDTLGMNHDPAVVTKIDVPVANEQNHAPKENLRKRKMTKKGGKKTVMPQARKETSKIGE